MDTVAGMCPVCNRNANDLQRHASTCGDKSRLRRSRFAPCVTVASGAAMPAAQVDVSISCQDSARPADIVMAKSCDCCAVVGQVCWFCLKSEPHLSRSLLDNTYGGLPILYHPTCIDGLTEHTDSSLIAAYKGQTERAGTAAHISGVGLSSMRCLSNAWLQDNRQQETLFSNSTARSESDKQHAGEEDVDDDSEDDATPLLQLAKTPRMSGPLGATRTPFQSQPSASDLIADASVKLAGVPLPTCTDSTDCKASESSQHHTSVKPSPFATQAEMQKAPSGSQQHPASQIFGNRPGFSWEFSGYVTAVPPVRSDERRVLSHHMSPRVTEMYATAQDGAAPDIKVLQFYEECDPGEWDQRFRQLVKTNVKQYLLRHMATRNVSSLLTNLPEDPDCSDSLEVKSVQEGDFREGLRPGIDVTVHAKACIPAGAVLGLYRNITVTKPEERIIQDNPPETFEGTINEWCQKLDAYTADIEQPKASYSKSRKAFSEVYEESLKNKPLACLAYTTGNILSCINDGCAQPFREEDEPWTEDQPQDKPDNVVLVAIAVGNWPFMFVVAKSEIAAGEELFLSYGDGFWSIQKDSIRAVMREKQRELELEQRFRASGTFTLDSQGGSQLHKACSGPPVVEAAMSANHACSGSMLDKPLKHAATAPIAVSKAEQVACQDFGVPVDKDDRLEAAADNQQELQQHESKDDTRGLQQPQTGEDAAVVDGPVLAAHVSSSHGYVEGATPAIKKAKSEVADSPSRSRLASTKELRPASAMLPRAAAFRKGKEQSTGGAGQGDLGALDQSQPNKLCTALRLRPVCSQQQQDLEAAIMQGSSVPHGFDAENSQRRCWAPCTDMESYTDCIQNACFSALAKLQQTGAASSPSSRFAVWSPKDKKLRACQEQLGHGSPARSKPAGTEKQGSVSQQPRRVPNAVDQTHQHGAQCPPCQSVLPAAQQDHPVQLRLLQSGAAQGDGTSSEQQKRLRRTGSATGSKQLATPLSGGNSEQQADAAHRDLPLSNDRDKRNPTSCTYPDQRPAGAALSKMESVNSRSNPFPSISAAIPQEGKTPTVPAKGGQHVSAKATRKRSHEQASEHLAHSAGPSRLGSNKPKQPAAKRSAVSGSHSNNKAHTKPSGSVPASGCAVANLVEVGKPGGIVSNHPASWKGLKASKHSRTKVQD